MSKARKVELQKLTDKILNVIGIAKHQRTTAVKYSKQAGPENKKAARLRAKIRDYQEENKRLRYENDMIRK